MSVFFTQAWEAANGLLGWLTFWAMPLLGLGGVMYYGISLPLRRQARALSVLDLLEAGLRDGRAPERCLVEAAGSRDSSLDTSFQLATAHMEMGMSLVEGLRQAPNLLPLPVLGMLQTGQEIGDLPRVLPACRKLLTDGSSKVRNAINYQVVLMFLLNPVFYFIMVLMPLKVLPVFREIAMGFGMRQPVSGMLSSIPLVVGVAELLLLVVMLGGFLGHLSGTRLRLWVNTGIFPVTDLVAWWLPWQRQRILRNFSLSLSLLLDAGVPEERAVRMAAKSTGNLIFMGRADKACARLAGGESLLEAVAGLDDRGELRWRLANAAHGPRQFTRALNGWHELLDARAFRLEQTTGQLLSTGLALVNGVLVAMIAFSIFRFISDMNGISLPK
jgi:type II secretory pathway component PulF